MNKFRRNDDSPQNQGPVTNERIRSNELRVTTHDGEALGIMSKQEALDLARQQDMDLILIVPKAEPPVAKIISLNKYNYELKKREKQQAKNARASAIEIKEVKFRPGIGSHDLQIKMKQAQKFIDGGAKVKITIQMRGRENAKAQDVLGHFIAEINEHLDNFKFEQPLKLAGNRILGVIQKDE
jgi:translation initiation factor IF-3